jgi:RNA ligase (TIGR02306 family)
VDSILPPALESRLFGIDSKIKLEKSRVRTIKIRGAISQGLVASLESVGLPSDTKVGKDVQKELGITKHEPVVQSGFRGQRKKKRLCHPDFKKYTDIENIKNYPQVFDEIDVIITSKIHGSNGRAGLLKFNAFSLWKRILKWTLLTLSLIVRLYYVRNRR